MKRSSLPSTRVPGLIVALAMIFLCGHLATRARADFSGPYTDTPPPGSDYDQSGQLDALFGTWFLSGDDYHFFALQINATPGAVTFDTGYAEDDGGGDEIRMMFTNTAADDGPLSFNYQLSLANTFDDAAGYSINGVYTSLAAGTGSVSGVTLDAGDVFGFYITAGPAEQAHGIASDTALTVMDFSAPVPEPSGGDWLGAGGGLGVAGLGWRRWRRLAKRAAYPARPLRGTDGGDG